MAMQVITRQLWTKTINRPRHIRFCVSSNQQIKPEIVRIKEDVKLLRKQKQRLRFSYNNTSINTAVTKAQSQKHPEHKLSRILASTTKEFQLTKLNSKTSFNLPLPWSDVIRPAIPDQATGIHILFGQDSANTKTDTLGT